MYWLARSQNGDVGPELKIAASWFGGEQGMFGSELYQEAGPV